jgi:peptidoglycan/LPS O-acetylase OafA/YrhL
MEKTSAEKRPRMRYVLLDLIRGFAIVLVLIAHIGQRTGSPYGQPFGIPHFYYVTLGGLGVTIFIILSGLVLELQYGSAKFSHSRFIAKRVLRIYPTYYLGLLVGIAVYFARNYPNIGDIFSPSLVIFSITGTHAFVGQWGGPFVNPGWFIGLLMVLYLFFPYLSRSVRHHPHITIGAMLLVSVLSRAILGQYDILPHRPLDWFPLCRVFEFSLGIYLASVIKPDLLLCINGSRRITSILKFIADISFPLFLAHFPLLIIITYLSKQGTHQIIAIVIFLFTSIITSWVILIVTNRLPRGAILRKVFRD